MDEDVDESPVTIEELNAARAFALVVEWYPEDEVYIVTAPDVPGWYYPNRSLTEAAELGQEGLAVWLSVDHFAEETISDPTFTNLPRFLRAAPADTGAVS